MYGPLGRAVVGQNATLQAVHSTVRVFISAYSSINSPPGSTTRSTSSATAFVVSWVSSHRGVVAMLEVDRMRFGLAVRTMAICMVVATRLCAAGQRTTTAVQGATAVGQVQLEAHDGKTKFYLGDRIQLDLVFRRTSGDKQIGRAHV